MGFGSYDESEQESREYDADLDEDEGVKTAESEHEGNVNYEFTASNDELLDRLEEMKGSGSDAESGSDAGVNADTESDS